MFNTSRRQGRSERNAEAYCCRYVEALSDARTPLAAVSNIRSVSKMPHACQNHRHPMFIRGFDDFCISDRSARLDDGHNTDFGCGIGVMSMGVAALGFTGLFTQ